MNTKYFIYQTIFFIYVKKKQREWGWGCQQLVLQSTREFTYTEYCREKTYMHAVFQKVLMYSAFWDFCSPTTRPKPNLIRFRPSEFKVYEFYFKNLSRYRICIHFSIGNINCIQYVVVVDNLFGVEIQIIDYYRLFLNCVFGKQSLS